jgi:hypothetical protein
MKKLLISLSLLLALAFVPVAAFSQAVPPGTIQVQLQQAAYPLIPISATAAVNNATALTIPAPSNSSYSNYICFLGFELGNDGTGAAITNQVSTSTNFNSFAVKVSNVGTANTDTGVQTLIPFSGSATGCVKSQVAGTATSFTAPASSTHIAWTWYASYFQAP